MNGVEFGDPRLPERFWAKVAVNSETGCWEWWAPATDAGYGRLIIDGRLELAHRAAFSALVGDLPPYIHGGPELDHLCRVRACVNPEHLELVSHRENVRRGQGLFADRARQTHCTRGHELAGSNLRPSTLRSGGRGCLTCSRDSGRTRSALIRDAHIALGMKRHDYRAAFGNSAATAVRILADLRSGVAPEAILAAATR